MRADEFLIVMLVALIAAAKTERAETQARIRELLDGEGDMADRSESFREGMAYVLNQDLAGLDKKIETMQSQLAKLGTDQLRRIEPFISSVQQRVGAKRMVTYQTEEK